MLTGALLGLENDGRFGTYEALFAEFCRQLSYLCGCAMELTDLFEAQYAKIHSAPILSATYRSALEKGGDLYCDYTARYNSSSLNAIGLATATDALAAIRKAVFEDQTVSLSRFVEILKSDWENEECFRLLIKNKYPKYGMGDARTDAIAKKIVDALADAVRLKPNAKGGGWRLGLFSINWRWELGAKTAASADGRCAGEPLSQNTSASFGADREGTTAHLLSVASIDAARVPNGAIADIDLHSSAVRGENGIRALVLSLVGYFSLGGFAVHYNVLDTATLEDARKHPEKYPNLQVRLCGWNVRFTLLSEKEQIEFIERSMR
jgi:formate C-acetyltransferase